MILLEAGQEGSGDVPQGMVKAHGNNADIDGAGVLCDDW